MRDHLYAGLAAIGLFALLLLTGIAVGRNLERRYIHVITPELGRAKNSSAEHSEGIQRMEHVKNQGLALQREAFRQPDLLPFYGSSELMKPIPDKASIFFRNYPSGFTVFPVGKAGATSLILLQKIAATAPKRHAKVAISLSPGWFMTPHDTDAHYYDGNFSAHQALALLFNPRLSFDLKRDLSRRMLDFPETLEKHALLHFAVMRLANGTALDRTLYALSLPLGLLETSVDSAQDHFETALYITTERKRWEPAPAHEPASLDWAKLVADAAHGAGGPPVNPAEAYHFHTTFASEQRFLQTLKGSKEWDDLSLLLRTVKELHLKALILSMPPPGGFLCQQGVSPAALATYGERLHQLTAERRIPLEIFEDHTLDEAFLADHHDHMSPKGWMYYNQALDEFYHSSPKRLLAHHHPKSAPRL